jgi:hypothetical protein
MGMQDVWVRAQSIVSGSRTVRADTIVQVKWERQSSQYLTLVVTGGDEVHHQVRPYGSVAEPLTEKDGTALAGTRSHGRPDGVRPRRRPTGRAAPGPSSSPPTSCQTVPTGILHEALEPSAQHGGALAEHTEASGPHRINAQARATVCPQRPGPASCRDPSGDQQRFAP